jgi:hypothetical protein
MIFKTTLSFLCLALVLWGGCSKEDEALPPEQIVKVRKPIIMPPPEKGKTSSLPQPAESGDAAKPAARQPAKLGKKEGGKEKVEPVKKDTGKKVQYAAVGKKSTGDQKELSKSRETEPTGPIAFKEVKKIRFEKTPGGGEKVLIWLSGKFPPQTFSLEGERPRVVCDFANARLGSNLGRSIKAGGRVIKEIRIGSYKGVNPKVRVVLDLVHRASGDYEVQPIFYKEENIFALVVK